MPDNSNRLAYWISLLFHPYIIILIPSIIILGLDGIIWAVIAMGFVVIPISTTVLWLQSHGLSVYQRESRPLLYRVGVVSVILCVAFMVTIDAPWVVVAGGLAVMLWGVIQSFINNYITKVSVHAGLIGISFTALLYLGHLENLILLSVALIIVFSVMWARVKTRNHTISQVLIGFLNGAFCAWVVFSLL